LTSIPISEILISFPIESLQGERYLIIVKAVGAGMVNGRSWRLIIGPDSSACPVYSAWSAAGLRGSAEL
jgi:hypothetical protein